MKAVKKWLAWIKRSPFIKQGMDIVEETSEGSFPASDPPCWAGGEHKEDILGDDASVSNPITNLRAEHQIIMKMIYLMHEQIELLEKNQPADQATLNKIINFMHAFVEDCHHQKEENFLFPALERSGAPLKDCSFNRFKEDHALSLQLLATLEKLSLANSKGEAEKLKTTLTDLIDIYTRHTLKEENFIFPLAEKYLSASAQKSLQSQFEVIDKKSSST